MADVRLTVSDLEYYGAQLMEAVGCSAADAMLVARALVRADMRGIYTHGVFRLPLYLKRLRAGGVNPRAVPKVVHESGAVAVVDGDAGLGFVVGHMVMEHALTLAQRYGIGAVATRNSNHFGAAAEYALLAPPRGCIGIAMTNTQGIMAPWQGKSALIGNNPIAFAAPTRDEPFVFDGALSQVAKGKIRVAAAEGLPIPPGWAFDAEGNPTTDARAALDGLLAPAGAYKGYGLSLAVEILTALLSGAVLGPLMQNQEELATPNGVGHFFLAIDVAHFIPLEEFTERLSAYFDQVRASEYAPGFDRIFIPGDIERKAEESARREGTVMVGGATWSALRREAEALNVRVPDLCG